MKNTKYIRLKSLRKVKRYTVSIQARGEKETSTKKMINITNQVFCSLSNRQWNNIYGLIRKKIMSTVLLTDDKIKKIY